MEGCRPLPFPLTEKNVKSTPGWPLKHLYKDEAQLIARHGFESYEHFETTMSNNFLWYVFLKHEMLKRSKVESNDIRSICCAPPQFTRMGARYEHNMNACAKQRTLHNECQVGWRPFYGGLDQRLRILADDATHFMELDWTRYDGTIPNELFECVSDFRVHCLEAKPELVRRYRWYRRCLLNRNTILATGDVVTQTKGNPSGQFSTSVDNCMFQTMLVAAMYGEWIFKNVGHYPTLDELRNTYRCISYGDDHLSCVKKRSPYFSYFPMSKTWICEFYKQHFGMWVKPENIIFSTTLEGLSFCGMTITKKNGRYVGVYRAHKIYASLAQPANPAATVEDLEAKCNAAALLLHHSDSPLANRILMAQQRLKELDPTFHPLTDRAKEEMWSGEDHRESL